MNTSALKQFATCAREELLQKVKAKAMKVGITEETIEDTDLESSDAAFVKGRQLSKTEQNQRRQLIARIRQAGYVQVMEEVAYTWFNRFTALRYMEVNDYLPTRVRVLSSTDSGRTEPDMMREALSLDLDIDKERVYDMKLNNDAEGLFKYLIIKHCNALNRTMPFMFEAIDDYTELLFPEGLLAQDSFIRAMTDDGVIPEADWENVEIIGWLYQFYNADEKERVMRQKRKYTAEELPFVTQLFTPKWIVRYMVQNALGRYWLESHPEHRELLENWEFYLESPDRESDIAEKLAPYINKELNVEDIKCFDPAMGSGHILVYMFDVLFEIYRKCGYTEREIPRLIIENNLYGLDIDDRAYQLACFSVVMKALAYNRRFLRSIERHGLTLNLAAIQETNPLSDADIAYIAGEEQGPTFDKTKAFIAQFRDAKTLGALIKVDTFDEAFLQQRLQEIENSPPRDLFESEKRERTLGLFESLLKQARLMTQKYDVLVTNPPYAGRRYLNKTATDFLDEHYADTKADLFSAFMAYSFYATKERGQIGLMTPFVWMFIATYEKLREHIIRHKHISSLVQLEYSGFDGATVPICTFTLRNRSVALPGEYVGLSDFRGPQNQPIKTLEAAEDPTVPYRYTVDQENFNKIPGRPIAYWASQEVVCLYNSEKRIHAYSPPRVGLFTCNNARFLRFWHEVSFQKMGIRMQSIEEATESRLTWFPYNKGGKFRKWYGNNEYVVNFSRGGAEISEYRHSRGQSRALPGSEFYFKEGITWSFISSAKFGVRYTSPGFIFDIAGSSLFPREQHLHYFNAFLSSKLAFELLKIQNPTLNFQASNIGNLPIIIDEQAKRRVEALSKENIAIAKKEWDAYETSWDFRRHPLLEHRADDAPTIEAAFHAWERVAEARFNRLKANEEELNRIFIDIYGLQDELTPEVAEEDVTVRKAELEREIKSFISYAVGCMFGRYSLDEEGLIYAGGVFDPSRYAAFPAEENNILPILPGAYFADDIVSRFVDFVQVTFSGETLEENLNFIAEVLKRRKTETAREAIRRYFLNTFFRDHVQTYKRRPIYWLFTSGKEKAFNCLIYMHRYDESTLARMRTDYLHPYQSRLDTERQDLLQVIEASSSRRDVSNARKELQALDRKIEELKRYDERLHHMADRQIAIDLDDGVKVNYEKFGKLVAKL